MENNLRKRLSNKRGMTMAEVLIVIAIIIILGAIVFINVINYQRTLAQLERDKIAQEIFIAAQNHLTVAKGEKYLGIGGGGGHVTRTTVAGAGYPADTADEKDVYYFVYSPGNASSPYTTDSSSILDLMLPFGSIDETIRTGGSYIIRYQKNTGTVLDVFYCSANGSPEQFNYNLDSDDYTVVMGLKGDQNKSDRRTFKGAGGDKNAVLGWYGNAAASSLSTITLKEPLMKVTNAEKLYVDITDANIGNTELKDKYSIRLIITGETSGAQKSYVLLKSTGSTENLSKDNDENKGRILDKTGTITYRVLLDDITTPYMHFANIKSEKQTDSETGAKTTINFIPGENIKIDAVAYSITAFANIAYSGEKVTNSLFQDIETNAGSGSNSGGTAKSFINNIRHLENLDSEVSNLNQIDNTKLKFINAEQTSDLYWRDLGDTDVAETKDFVQQIKSLNGDNNSPQIYKYKAYNNGETNEAATEDGYYLPASINSISYDGKSNSIYNILASGDKSGLFGTASNSVIQNVRLVDFDITGSEMAGALAGSFTGDDGNDKVNNVLAINTGNNNIPNIIIKGTNNASVGGLIGSLDGGAAVEYSAAAMIVDAGTSGTAGGLIGSVSGSASVNGSYAGGHTKNGSYKEWIYTNGDMTKTPLKHPYDVTGSNAGGLIGSISGGTVTKSYSTCSVSGSTNAGGFVGSKSNGTVSYCYCTGLVNDSVASSTTNKNVHAFIGSGAVGGEGNNYFSIINEATDEKTKLIVYMEPAAEGSKTGISAIDEPVVSGNAITKSATDVFNDFTEDTCPAKVYDNDESDEHNLSKIYNDKYVLRPIKKMVDVTDAQNAENNFTLPSAYYVNTHYGDWPAPEVFVINN